MGPSWIAFHRFKSIFTSVTTISTKHYFTLQIHIAKCFSKVVICTTSDLQQRYVKLIEFQVSRLQELQRQIDEMVTWAKRGGMDEMAAVRATYSALSMLEDYPGECPLQTG
jgi:hypothetical protein